MIAIIGILAAIGIVNLSRWRATSAVMEGAQQFAQAVSRTRTDAKRANACRQIRLTGATTGTTQYEVRRFPLAVCSGTATSTQTYTMPPGTTLTLMSAASTNDVNFKPPYGTTDPSPNSYEVQWAANTGIKRVLRLTSVFGKVIIK